jgi:hypothetical protein
MEESEIPWRVRQAVYHHFIEHGTAPTIDQLTKRTGLAADGVRGSLGFLAAHHQIVFAPASSEEIWMAHPFSGIPTEFLVSTATGSYWANCAWDLFGIAALLRQDGHAVTRCAETGETAEVYLQPGRPVTAPGVVHFLVPPRHFWKNVAFT